MIRKIKTSLFIALSVCMLSSCLDKYPQDEIPADSAITTIDEANQAVIGIYSAWLSGALYSGYLTLLPDLQADLAYAVNGYTNTYGDIWRWDILATNSQITSVYGALYDVIGRCNFLLHNVDKVRENIIEVAIPYGMRTCVEWHYLLGDFGVNVMGEYRELTAKPAYLGFDTVTVQGLAHYGSNITYKIPVTTHGGKLRITVPHYAGAAVLVKVGEAEKSIVYPPYQTELELPAGDHELQLRLLGTRQNCFGTIHNANPAQIYVRPSDWRTEDNNWTESYRLKPLGILSAPLIEEIL